MKIVSVIGALVVLIVLFNYCNNTMQNPATATYVGTAKCQGCHAKEYNLYTTSDHFHAMDSATLQWVKGDFNNSYFVYNDDTAFFYHKGNNFFVRTIDASNTMKEFAVHYTFGWDPLQQYLVKTDGGAIQVLPFCWDTRPKEKGGQRWFHIYGREKITPGDELFWTGINQNWNYMCADCHTTGYQKNFDDSSHSFHSSWAESKVSCESCHGPASAHLQWAAHPNDNMPYKGFVFSLANKATNWVFDNNRGIAMPQEVHINHAQIETCARCHARATRFTDRYRHGQPLIQSHWPALIDTANYYVDGQIREEDYEYGSFLQSKMYAIGVSCSNCHDAHSMRIKQPGNSLCASCHAPATFDVPEHTHHVVNSAGAQCVNCHMPATTYMQVDERRDHSLRIPRPDLSLTLGTPNACNKCHTGKTVQWAADHFLQWYKDKLPAHTTYGELLHTVSQQVKESEYALYELLTSKNYPAIIKATALEQSNGFSRPGTRDQVLHFLQDADPLLRLHAVKALAAYPAEIVLPAVSPLLNDSIQSVRMEALVTLAPYAAQLDETAKQTFNKVTQEYMGVQRSLSHRPEGYLNRGILLGQTGQAAEAEKIYLAGMQKFPAGILLYVNLADTYRQLQNETKAKEYIDKGLAIQPANASLYYALGLWYIRQKDYEHGIAALQRSVSLNPSDAAVVYAYAVGLFSTGKAGKALQLLENYTRRYGNRPLILDGIISMGRNNAEKANHYIALRKEVYGY